MDMALSSLNHWSQPLQALARWLLTPINAAPPKAFHASKTSSPLAKRPGLLGCTHRSHANTAPDSLRTVLPLKRQPTARRVGWSHRSAAHSTPQATRPALRVFIDTSQKQTGRLAITGRMADVCAELDRLAEREQMTTGTSAKH
jgi:hypothetical protein